MNHFYQNHSLKSLLAILLIVFFTPVFRCEAQVTDSAMIRQIYSQALTDSRCYPWLEYLCLRIGHRLSGSAGAEKAVNWTRMVMDTLGLDSVWLQPVDVPHWVRGKAEQVTFKAPGQKKWRLNALALGGSVGTPDKGVTAPLVEIKSWEQLAQLGKAEKLKGKIVFYNRAMDMTRIRTFDAYGRAVDQRSIGASRAAQFGAVAVLVRSMGMQLDDSPHTGAMRYDSNFALIPAAAISTNDAERLSKEIALHGDKAQVTLKMNCQTFPDVLSYNVIGEIRGTEKTNEYIIVGGHLDSWDVGHGAHDDGTGCMQSMDVLRYFKRLNIKPRHTIRCVLFMNEENGLRGGRRYAAEAKRKGENHVLAIETDAGGFTPRGFTFDGHSETFKRNYEKVKKWESLFLPYGLNMAEGGSGADIGPLKELKGLLSGYSPDSQRYFDLHHTPADTFDKVHKRELELGAASMAALVYLVDKYF